jgi:3-oxoacyl-[acyl-carrier protein] reductase
MEISLKGKNALVTASTKGIGFGVARSLYQAGAKVCLCSRRPEAVEEAAARVGEGDRTRVLGLAGDLGEPAFLARLVRAAVEGFGGPLDILVNNSGGPPFADTLELTEEQWQGALDRNFLSVVRLCALVAPGMKEKRWGRIINLTSMSGKEPGAGMALSNATRAAVAAYSKTLATELGPFGITINTVLTGGVLTDRLRDLFRIGVEGTEETVEAAIARSAEEIPVRHFATPDEFARTVLFLASEEASYLTGVALPLDGGASKTVF